MKGDKAFLISSLGEIVQELDSVYNSGRELGAKGQDPSGVVPCEPIDPWLLQHTSHGLSYDPVSSKDPFIRIEKSKPINEIPFERREEKLILRNSDPIEDILSLYGPTPHGRVAGNDLRIMPREPTLHQLAGLRPDLAKPQTEQKPPRARFIDGYVEGLQEFCASNVIAIEASAFEQVKDPARNYAGWKSFVSGLRFECPEQGIFQSDFRFLREPSFHKYLDYPSRYSSDLRNLSDIIPGPYTL